MESSKKSGTERSSRDKRKKRSGQQQQQHHPWDEDVSLPGAGDNGGDAEANSTNILKVLGKQNFNNKTADEQSNSQADEAANYNVDETFNAQIVKAEAEGEANTVLQTVASIVNDEAADLVTEQEHAIETEAGIVETAAINDLEIAEKITAEALNNILDVESHLIETFNEKPDEVVGIIEEVIETKDDLEPTAVVENCIESVQEDTKTAATTALDQDINVEIRQAAENLVNEIESKALETLNSQTIKQDKTDEQVVGNNETSDLQEKQEPEQQPVNLTLSQRVDEQLSEVTSILKKTTNSSTLNDRIDSLPAPPPACDQIKLVDVPSPKTPSEFEERKLFIDSLPQISAKDSENEAQQLAVACKREYYQSLKKYLIQSNADKPPIPLQTYRWEDLRRAKERGGYPWTHLYKRPLGPDEEPEIVLLLRQSQEFRFLSESPKSLKKVRIDDQVLIKETERYIQELSEEEEEDEETADDEHSQHDHQQQHHSADESESHSLHSESISCISDSVLATGKSRKPYLRLANIRAIIKRRRSARSNEDAQSLPGTLERPTKDNNNSSSRKPPKVPKIQVERTGGSIELINGEQSPQHKSTPTCYPIMKKLKSMADRQKKRLNIRRVPLKKDERIVLNDETKILKLKSSPKSERGEIPHFIEKQDSDDILEIVELDESPSRKRKDEDFVLETAPTEIENSNLDTQVAPVVPITTITEAEDKANEIVVEAESTTTDAPPKKAPRLRREHVYEEINENEHSEMLEILPQVASLKESLQRQDAVALTAMQTLDKPLPLDRMGSSEDDPLTAPVATGDTPKSTLTTLAPLSSIDSASSDEDRNRPHLSPVAEESDAASASDYHLNENEIPCVIEEQATNDQQQINELKPSIKKEASPAPSDKKVVTFSHVEDEAEPHREDIELPEHVLEATAAAKKAKNSSEHEYEPIGVPPNQQANEAPQPQAGTQLAAELEILRDDLKEAENLQRDLEERYLSSEATTPRTESRTDYEIHTSQVDSSALEELPLKPENRKKSFMASAQDRTRRMQAGFKTQAGKIKTKLRSGTPANKKSSTTANGSPKAKERRRFKAPEFSKMKMPDIKRPDMSKLKDFKRPEFTKFNKPDMSKFKLPEKFSTLKLQRSKSLKENEPPTDNTDAATEATSAGADAEAEPHKKLFDFSNFGTYPRAFRKKKKPPVEPVESSFGTGTATEGLSVVTSTDTQPSFESSNSPHGDRGPGPVRSRWADKFSDVSYNDSEGSRYRRYGSELESFDRESSLERRMKEDLEPDTASEAAPPEMGILSSATTDSKQFAEFDEENRAIHEISSLRAGEFKRRPMVHQDSDLRSEDSRDAVGWTDKEMQKIKLLRKAEIEAEASYLKFPPEDVAMANDAQSTASSGKKVVMEEIDDDEFFLRKRGVSEDNIELRQYISNAIREGYDIPINTLEHVGKARQPIEYNDYDVPPPPKPRRLHKSYRPQDVSQELSSQRSDYGDDLSMSQNDSDFFGAPKRPMRKGRSRSKYSMESQDEPLRTSGLDNKVDDDDEHTHVRHEIYFDDDEEYLRPPKHRSNGYTDDSHLNNLDYGREKTALEEVGNLPQAPHRRKRHLRDTSAEKDSLVNSLSGRSVSNNYLQPTEDVTVYRTENEYYKSPLVKPENYNDSGSRYVDEKSAADVTDSVEPASSYKFRYYDEEDLETDAEFNERLNKHDKYIIQMAENDGYAVVRKDQVPKPTPPARRKKFSRAVVDRFGTASPMSIIQRETPPPPERPPPPRGYTPSVHSMELQQKYEDDYEEPGELIERPESPRDLQSGEIINRMKYRPLPPPPRPPREKRQRNDSRLSNQGYDEKDSSVQDESSVDHLDVHDGNKRAHAFSSDESYGGETDDAINLHEVEVSTQTDPLPDDYVCEEFEITADMRVIEPRIRTSAKTLDDLLKDEHQQVASSPTGSIHMTEDEQLARGLQRFRDANQRSLSERSRASSQADRSKSLSRPQTPSAIIIERRVSTPVPSHRDNETMLEAALIVRPIDDLDLEEAELRREGLLSDAEMSQQSRSAGEEEEIEEEISKYNYEREATSSTDLNAAVDKLKFMDEEKSDEEILQSIDAVESLVVPQRTLRDYGYSEEEAADDEAERYSNEEIDGIDEILSKEKEATQISTKQQVEKRLDQAIEDMIERHIRGEYTSDEQEFEQDEPVPPPQPPPRRKSGVGIETSTAAAADPSTSSTTQAISPVENQSISKEVTPVQTIESTKEQLPSYMGDLEVERLRVRALQAGQIMVSQLHGAQICAEELECKSGNLVVKSLELPPGFIEEIVDRVRSSERGPLSTIETQTSLQSSRELLDMERDAAQNMVPPPKPPRHRELDNFERHRNHDEETQTEKAHSATPPLPPVFATTQYLETLVPLIRRDLESRGRDEAASLLDQDQNSQTSEAALSKGQGQQRRQHHHHHRHHHHYRRCSSSSSDLNNDDDHMRDFDADGNYRSRERHRHGRSRSRTHPPSECPSQSVSQAGKQFISACSLSLVNIIDQLTACVRDSDVNKAQDGAAGGVAIGGARLRQVPTLVVLFIVILFGILIFLLTGRNVHTHHWDFFNPPGNEGRQT